MANIGSLEQSGNCRPFDRVKNRHRCTGQTTLDALIPRFGLSSLEDTRTGIWHLPVFAVSFRHRESTHGLSPDVRTAALT